MTILTSEMDPTALTELVLYVASDTVAFPSGSFGRRNLNTSSPVVIVAPDVDVNVNVPV